MHRGIIWLLLVGLIIGTGFGIYHFSQARRIAATCTGAADCKACKTCRYCKHCAKEGGTCGVSKAATRRASAAVAMECCDD